MTLYVLLERKNYVTFNINDYKHVLPCYLKVSMFCYVRLANVGVDMYVLVWHDYCVLLLFSEKGLPWLVMLYVQIGALPVDHYINMCFVSGDMLVTFLFNHVLFRVDCTKTLANQLTQKTRTLVIEMIFAWAVTNI